MGTVNRLMTMVVVGTVLRLECCCPIGIDGIRDYSRENRAASGSPSSNGTFLAEAAALTTSMMRILVADDHAIVREGLRLILESSSLRCKVSAAGSSEELFERLREGEWDLLLLDLRFPDRSGLEILQEVRLHYPSLPVLVLSMHVDEQYVIRALRSGASGYLTKDSAPSDLMEAIARVTRGGRYVTPAIAEVLLHEVVREKEDPRHLLSERELDVLCRTARGESATAIGQELGISVKTVSTYRTRALEKLGLKNSAQLIHYAIEHGLV